MENMGQDVTENTVEAASLRSSVVNLVRTCWACPEQYDAMLDGEIVGYLRLRHGGFSVQCPDVGGDLVYEASPRGDGIFDDDERDYYLRFAVDAILKWLANGRQALNRPQAPDVAYRVTG